MKNVSLNYLKLSSFCSFVDEQTLQLPKTGLVGIKGLSGSGKSNLHLGISFALNFCPYPSTELQPYSFLTDKKIQVELGISVNEQNHVIKRGSISSFNDIVGASNLNSELRKVIPLDASLIEALTFREQRKPGRFLSLTDSSKKEFLSTIIGLQELEEQIEKYTKKCNELSDQIIKNKTIIDTLKGQLVKPVKKYPNIDVDIEQIRNEIEIIDNDIGDYDKKIASNIAIIKKLHSEFEIKINHEYEVNMRNPVSKIRELGECDSAIIEEEISIKQKNNRINDDIVFEKRGLVSCIKDANKLSGLKEKLNTVNLAIDGIRAKKCPTCDQTWISNNEALSALTEDARILSIFIASAIKAQEMSVSAQERIEKLKNSLTNTSPELERLKILQKQLEKEVHEIDLENSNKKLFITSKYKDSLNVETTNLYKNNASFGDSKILLQTRKQDLKIQLANLNSEESFYWSIFKTWEDSNLKLTRLEDELKDLQTKHNQESDYVDLLRSFLGAIFEEILHEIAIETNAKLALLPNVSAVTIEFTTERATQKGTVRQEIRPIVYNNGQQVLFNRLSGGQKSSIELATDFSVAEVISRRTGIRLNWMILDESFDGLDTPSKECCLEMLKNLAQNKLIILIEHSTEVKEYFDRYIEIKNENGKSYIKEV